MATVNGSIEILTDSGATSNGIVVRVTDVADIPAGLEALRSMTGFAAVDPPRANADAEWTATTADGFPAVVVFREDVPYQGPPFPQPGDEV